MKIFYGENRGVTQLCDVRIIDGVKPVFRQLCINVLLKYTSVWRGVHKSFRKLQYVNFLDNRELAKIYCRFSSS
jgi:hypothetical protein